MSTDRSLRAGAVKSLAAGLVLSLAAGPALADDGIDWITALRAYYTAQVVYERCGFHATWEQLNALSASIDDAEREGGAPEHRADLDEGRDRGRGAERRVDILRGKWSPPDVAG